LNSPYSNYQHIVVPVESFDCLDDLIWRFNADSQTVTLTHSCQFCICMRLGIAMLCY
jgi:hypothetical protein